MWTITPEFSVAGLGIAITLATYLLVADPFLGRALYRRLERERDTDGALARFYGRVTAIWVAVVALAAGAVLVSPGVSFADLGFRLGDPEALQFWVVVPLAFAVLMGAVFQVLRAKAGHEIPGLEQFRALLPRTAGERRIAIAYALVEGICAHVVMRGLLIALAMDLIGGVPGAVVGVVISIAASVAGAWYRGIPVIVGAGVVGLMLNVLYVMSGGLLLPTGLHILMLIRDLLMPSAAAPSGRAQPEGV